MLEGSTKSAAAFRTISELAAEIGLPQHILRYWETRFPQLRPLQRAGKRRYYRPEDVALVRRINRMLNEEGYTVKAAQRLISGRKEPEAETLAAPKPAAPQSSGSIIPALIRIRDQLSRALAEDDVAARI
jgi:DNA-binding transcriptional MerR regulator